MGRTVPFRVGLALAIFLASGQGAAVADTWKPPTDIFAEVKRPNAKEPRVRAREGRTIVLRSAAWSRDILDDGLPWLDIDLMMEAGDVSSYFEGVEVQYEMRRILTDAPCSLWVSTETQLPDERGTAKDQERFQKRSCWQGAYEISLRTAKEKISQERSASNWLPVKFESLGDFVAVFNADETLLTQWFNPLKINPIFRLGWFADGLEGVPSDLIGEKRSGNLVRFAPGAEEALLRLHADPRCKGIAVFSSKEDEAAKNIFDRWKSRRENKMVWEKRPNGKALIQGFFSRSHLTMGGDPLNGGVAYVPSKNLRIFDPKLQNVVIVDDKPARIIPEQQYLLRAQPKFDSRGLLESEADPNSDRVNKYYSRILEQTADEILESSARAEGSRKAKVPKGDGELGKMPFAQAFRPYSLLGRRVLDALRFSIPEEKDNVPDLVLRFMHVRPRASGDKLEREALEAARTKTGLYEAAFDSY